MPFSGTFTDPDPDLHSDIDIGLVTRNLIHRPTGIRAPLPGTALPEAEYFLIAGPVPDRRPFALGGPGTLHDSHVFVQVAQQVGVFIANHYFQVPADRPGVLYKVDLGAPHRAERGGPGDMDLMGLGDRAQMSMDICARPRHTVNQVPRGLRFEANLHIDGAESCVGAADLVFLTPNVHRGHRASSRLATVAALTPEQDARERELPHRPCEPEAVAREDPGDVLVADPHTDGDTLTSRVLVDTAHPVYYAETSDSVPGPLQIEALRQMALLAAAHFHGFHPLRTDLIRTTVHFRAYAENDLPLSCHATVEPLWARQGGPAATRVALSLVQQGRTVADATVTAARAY
ncbi:MULTISPECIES: AfsA-related hotdog domain-containing protein [unclassified Streptomyces]|uniref:AfsA-related hotdog domain-containing protein n=1 Tax=unclassified Streptomyces TaxID=2593676 RepID=UPI002E2A1FE3|nr:AfsA-related hotdog domain-containing protein [Streptomyces sp. NBC_00223]